MIKAGRRVFAHRFEGYWRDVGTVEAFWKANLDLVGLVPPLDLFDRSWLIHTRSEERSPAKSGPDAVFRHSLASHGCIINGTVVNSLLSPGVKVYDGAVVRDSVVMLDAEIGPGAVVDGAIIDKHVSIGPGAVIGHGDDRWVVNAEEPDRLTTGITVIGKRAVVPPGARLGRNVRVDTDVVPEDFTSLEVPSGGTVHHRDGRAAGDGAPRRRSPIRRRNPRGPGGPLNQGPRGRGRTPAGQRRRLVAGEPRRSLSSGLHERPRGLPGLHIRRPPVSRRRPDRAAHHRPKRGDRCSRPRLSPRRPRPAGPAAAWSSPPHSSSALPRCSSPPAAGLAAWDAGYDGRVLPGVHVGGVDVSGMDRPTATRALAAAFAFDRGRLVLRAAR